MPRPRPRLRVLSSSTGRPEAMTPPARLEPAGTAVKLSGPARDRLEEIEIIPGSVSPSTSLHTRTELGGALTREACS